MPVYSLQKRKGNPSHRPSICFLSVWYESLSYVRLFSTSWTGACQASLSMGFSRQEYWSGLPFPSPGDLPNQGLNPGLLHCRWFFTIWAPRETLSVYLGFKGTSVMPVCSLLSEELKLAYTRPLLGICPGQTPFNPLCLFLFCCLSAHRSLYLPSNM